ncbi:MAG: hypothetical protein R3E93_11120 [Thiothrix sp.]
MKKLLIIPLSALLLAACVDTFDVKPDSKLQSQLLPDAKVTDEGHLLASGRVVSISDGDTLTVLGANNQRYKSACKASTHRKNQPYGQKWAALMMATANPPVEVEAYKLTAMGASSPKSWLAVKT